MPVSFSFQRCLSISAKQFWQLKTILHAFDYLLLIHISLRIEKKNEKKSLIPEADVTIAIRHSLIQDLAPSPSNSEA